MKEKTKNELGKWIGAAIVIVVSVAITIPVVLGISYLADNIPYMAILPFVLIIIFFLLAIRSCKKDIDKTEQEVEQTSYLLDCYCRQLWKLTRCVEPTKDGYYLVKNIGTVDAEVAYFCQDAEEHWSTPGETPTWWCELPSEIMGFTDNNLDGYHFDEYGMIHKHKPLPKYNR